MDQAVASFVKRHRLLAGGERIVIGVSGGADSMALLDYLVRMRDGWSLSLVAASVDHGLRGEESAADLCFVRDWCGAHDVAFVGKSLDVRTYQIEQEVSEEAAARTLRYRFFARVLREYKADKLALAHHGDDQVETMLMRQVRGSFGAARSGMPVRRPFAGGEVIRPFLAVDKAQIQSYLEAKDIRFREDPSNASDAYTRNRFRHHVLPFLKKENPHVHSRFQQESEMLLADHHYLQQLARGKLDEVVASKQPAEIVLSASAFSRVPEALQRRMIHLLLSYLYDEPNPSSLAVIHMEQFLALTKPGPPHRQLDFPRGLRVIRSYDQVILTYEKKGGRNHTYTHALQVPDTTEIPKGQIVAEIKNEQPEEDSGFFCDADLVCYPLTVRTRKAGDRLSLRGMDGSKKVKTIFIEEKIARACRETWPIIVDAQDELLWLPGLRKADYAKTTSATMRFLTLQFEWNKSERRFHT